MKSHRRQKGESAGPEGNAGSRQNGGIRKDTKRTSRTRHNVSDALVFIASECMRREGASLRIAPMAFMVAHLADDHYRDFYRALTDTGKMTSLRALAVEHLSAKFESELNVLARGRDPRTPVQVVAHFVAANFMDLIEWWFDNEGPYPPQQMQAIFEGLVRPAIERAIGVPLG